MLPRPASEPFRMTTLDAAANAAAAPAPGTALRRRAAAAGVALASGGLLGTAALLEPATEGLGTHVQMGMAPCGWIALMDLPCPTCGMTTSFALAADGRIAASFLNQPLGAALAIGTAMTFLLALYVAATGSRIVSALPRPGRTTGWWLAGAVLAAWTWKILTHKGVL